jgi:quercetin dioxygenase-like cupin family protein
MGPYSKDLLIQTLLKTELNSVGQRIAYPPGAAEVTVLYAELPPGKETGWHEHPVSLVGYILSGEVTVYFRERDKQVYRAGEAVAEAVNLAHNGVNEGMEPARMLVFVLGQPTQPYVIKK